MNDTRIIITTEWPEYDTLRGMLTTARHIPGTVWELWVHPGEVLSLVCGPYSRRPGKDPDWALLSTGLRPDTMVIDVMARELWELAQDRMSRKGD